MGFKKATKEKARLRMALIGVSGSGKTYTALNIAKYLADGGSVAVIDTERGSASKYAGLFDFDVINLEHFAPQEYVKWIQEAAKGGYSVLVIDSLSHAWMGKGGALEMVDAAAKRSQGNSFMAWRDVTPHHNALIDAMLAAPMHIIVTMRAKSEYVIETNERGKSVPKKVGLAPIQRDGMEYEMDVVADLDTEHNFIVSKSRCSALAGGVFKKAGKEVADVLREWLTDGVEPKATDDTLKLMHLLGREYYGDGWKDEFKQLTGKQKSTDLLESEAQAAITALRRMLESDPSPSDPAALPPVTIGDMQA